MNPTLLLDGQRVNDSLTILESIRGTGARLENGKHILWVSQEFLADPNRWTKSWWPLPWRS